MKNIVFLAALAATPALADTKVEIPFTAQIAGQPFSCAASYDNIGTTKSTVQVADFRLYVSHFRLINAEGTEVAVTLDQDGIWQLEGSALLDFEDATAACANGTAETNTVVKGTAPDGDYVSLAFDIGLPFAQDHGDASLAASPLNQTAMFWSWQSGYKFIKIDLSTSGRPLPAPMKMDGAAKGMDMSGPPPGWSLHLGSTGCAGESKTSAPAAECANPNLVAVKLDNFMLGMEGMGTVVLDPAPVLEASDVDANAPETAPGCMSFPKDSDCPAAMNRLGLSYDGAAGGTQVFATLR